MGGLHVKVDPTACQAIERVDYEHAWSIDHGQVGKLPSLQAEDGRVFSIGPDNVGRAAIAGLSGQRQTMTERQSRHVQTNIRLDPVSDQLIRGTAVLTLYRHDGPGRAVRHRCSSASMPGPCKMPGRPLAFAERRLPSLFS